MKMDPKLVLNSVIIWGTCKKKLLNFVYQRNKLRVVVNLFLHCLQKVLVPKKVNMDSILKTAVSKTLALSLWLFLWLWTKIWS